ncbi:hypothetical protein [Rhizobacter sp. LjRoot28]|uniref:hypothetical protein n=1 Tax=Rhizobacter sp. LjRoot28 TaxID=3342309 RepID=UPI003ECE6AE6
MKQSLSIHRAARLLNVSPAFLMGEFNRGVLPLDLLGGHHHVAASEFHAYRQRLRAVQTMAMLELSQQAQQLNMGYGDS